MAVFPVRPVVCRLVTCAPEAASGGLIALVEEGDTIAILIYPGGALSYGLTLIELAARRTALEARGPHTSRQHPAGEG